MLFENTGEKKGEKRKFSITLSNGQEKSFDTASDMSVWYEKRKNKNKHKIRSRNKTKKPREK